VRKEKQFLLDEVKEKIDSSSAFVVTRYGKIRPNQANEFRGALAKKHSELEVVRKRVFLKACEKAGIQGFNEEMLNGSIALVFASQDPIEATKQVFEFQGANAEEFEVLGGYLDGKAYTGADMKRLSTLPGKDEMRSQLLGLFEAPMSQTLAVMEALLCSVIHCLNNKANEGSEAN
jgi:large subunit ribosomal protein L10